MNYSNDNKLSSKYGNDFDFDTDWNIINIGNLNLSYNVRNHLFQVFQAGNIDMN